jgi:hypothetical protein
VQSVRGENGLPLDGGIGNGKHRTEVTEVTEGDQSGSEVSLIEKRSRRVFETEKGPGRSCALG